MIINRNYTTNRKEYEKGESTEKNAVNRKSGRIDIKCLPWLVRNKSIIHESKYKSNQNVNCSNE